MITAEGLTKYYGPARGIVDVSFTVAAGQTVGLLGPNGAGKTTTMRILTGLFPPSRGTVSIDGIDVADDPIEAKRRIGYLPEMTPLYLEMPVRSLLSFAAGMKGIPRRSRRARVDEVIERCALGTVAHRVTGRLSKGYRQRVGLAQALLNDPPVLILDEPTIGLDPGQTFEFRRLIQSMRGRRTIILSTHILPEVSMTCEQVLIISAGRLIAQDSPERLASRLRDAAALRLRIAGPEDGVRAFLGESAGVAETEFLGTAEDGSVRFRIEYRAENDPRRDLLAGLVERGWTLLEMVPEEAGLEEVFVNLVTEEASQ